MIATNEHDEHGSKRFMVPLIDGFAVCDIKDICYMRSSGNHTLVVTADQGSVESIRNLKHFEEQLDGFPFFKTHRTAIVNTHHVRKYLRSNEGRVVMSDGEEVPVAHDIKKEFFEFIRIKKSRLNILCIGTNDEFRYVETGLILYLESRKATQGFKFGVNIQLEEKRALSASKHLGYFEDELSFDPFFLRVSSSAIAHLTKVKKYRRANNGYWAIMKDEYMLSVSADKKDALLSFFDK